jgi:hypothetical protein
VNRRNSIGVQCYLASVIVPGSLVFWTALSHWTCADPQRFLTYLALAAVAGALKIRHTVMTGTYSLNFLFVLVSLAELSQGETLVIAGSSMIVQLLWRPAHRPSFVQVAFNVSAVAISVWTSALTLEGPMHWGWPVPFAVRFLLAAAVYFLVNTLLISGILSLVESMGLKKIWGEWFRWSVPYYLAGVVVAGMMIVFKRYVGWKFALLLLPIMYLEHLCRRLMVDSGERAQTAPID